jgi:hypothetical protein
MRKYFLALMVALGLVVSACGGTTSTTETQTIESAAASTTEGAATTTEQPASGSGSPTTVAASTTSTIAPELSEELIKLLTITRPETDCVKVIRESGQTIIDAEGVKMYWGQIEATLAVGNGGRVDSDSIGTPLEGATPEELFEAVQVAVCKDAYVASMVANFFANLTLNGRNVVDMNDWLIPSKGAPEDIVHVIAAKYDIKPVELATSNKPTADEAKAIKKLPAKAVEFQEFAGKVNTLLTRFRLDGVQSLQSVKNYHLRDGGLVAEGLPIAELNPRQENLPALILVLTEKGQCPPILIIGFNLQDKRLEQFPLPSCEPPTPTTHPGSPTTTAPPNTTVTTCPNCGTTTTTTTTVPEEPCVPPNYRNPSGKCVPPTTVPPSADTTVAPTTPTTQPGSVTTVAAGTGATNTTAPPTTAAPAPAPPTTATPTTNATAPSEG